MRPPIINLDVDEMPWSPLGPPGLYTKLLSRDPETGARTALQRMVPSEGLVPPQTAHYHHTYEEILVIKGRFTFDSRNWVVPLSYCFHPPETVHGFKSAVPEESWFLSRVGRDLDVNLVEKPEDHRPYYVSDVPPARCFETILDPSTERDWSSATWITGKGTATQCILSRHPETGEGSALLRVSSGWETPYERHSMESYFEMFVIEGSLQWENEAGLSALGYAFIPPNMVRPRLSSPSGAVLYINFDGTPRLMPR